jgi:menaquinone C8-methyltransferase
LIPEIAARITRREGQKFLQLQGNIDESRINRHILRAGEQLSLYIHIPFCRKLCPFCCFNRYLFVEDKARAYFRSLRQELDMYIQKGFTFAEVYIGGGTPTILMDELKSFISYLRKNYRVEGISLETTPAELTPENIRQLKSLGVKRLSVGVQSFDDDSLKAMGRVLCMGEETKERLLLAQGQFATLNIDLIFNFPFQTLDKFAADIDTFKKLGIDQVTFYPLMPSPHKKSAMERRFTRVDNSREKQFYNIILQKVFQQGFTPSTVWCFSRGDRMIDEYIVDYADYIGIGAGSVSLVNGYFFVNTFSLEKYSSLIDKKKLPIVRSRDLSEHEYLRYYLLTKLFGMKVDKDQFKRQFEADIYHELGYELRLLKIAGAIVERGNEIRVTPRGMYIVNGMMREFFSSLNSLRELCIEKQV